jgi:hypothetical protein
MKRSAARSFLPALLALLVLLALGVGCGHSRHDHAASSWNGGASDDDDTRGGDGGGSDDDAGGVTGYFDPTGEAGFFASAFPSDLRLNASGTIHIADFPNPRGSGILSSYLALGEREIQGFGADSGIFFPMNGPIDFASLPATFEASEAADASAFLVSLDPTAPDYGRRYPVEFQFTREPMVYGPPNLLVMLPLQGLPMEHGRAYGAVVTTGVLDTDGSPLVPNPVLQRVLAGTSGESRAEAVFAPLADYLNASAVPLEHVAVATVYTTMRPLDRMIALRDHVYAYDLPGIDPASVALAEDWHDFYFLSATVTLPMYQSGTPPYLLDGGEILFDAAGVPIVDHDFQTRLAITIPATPMPPGGWPFLIFCHGSGGSWRNFIDNGTGRWLAWQGIAAASIDAPLHGPRAPWGDSSWWSIFFYNAFNPLSFRDNNVQAAVESMALLRQLRDLRMPAGVVPGGEARFDPDHIYFIGHSQGSTVGPLLVAVDPNIQAAYFSGAGSSLLWNLLTKQKPFPVLDAAIVALKLMPEEFGELDRFHPALNLLQHMAETTDTLSFNPYLYERLVPGAPPKHVFQAIGVTDGYVGLQSHGAFSASAGLDLIEPVLAQDTLDRVLLAGGTLLSDEGVSANRVDREGDPVTAAVVQYPAPPSGRDGHYVTWEFPSLRRRVRCYFRTALEHGTPTVVGATDDEYAPCE